MSKLSHQYSELESELQSSISNNSSIRHPRPRPSKQTRSTNGSVRSMRRGKLSKSIRAQDDLVLSSSNGSDLSLSALDVSSPSDTDFTSVQLEKSNRGNHMLRHELSVGLQFITVFTRISAAELI